MPDSTTIDKGIDTVATLSQSSGGIAVIISLSIVAVLLISFFFIKWANDHGFLKRKQKTNDISKNIVDIDSLTNFIDQEIEIFMRKHDELEIIRQETITAANNTAVENALTRLAIIFTDKFSEGMPDSETDIFLLYLERDVNSILIKKFDEINKLESTDNFEINSISELYAKQVISLLRNRIRQYSLITNKDLPNELLKYEGSLAELNKIIQETLRKYSESDDLFKQKELEAISKRNKEIENFLIRSFNPKASSEDKKDDQPSF